MQSSLLNNKKRLANKAYGAIIPHAGIQYAGDARKSAFDLLKDKYKDNIIKHIIYISALHNNISSSNKTVYESYRDSTFSYNFNTKTKKELPPNVVEEHSFKWVHSELKRQFPKTKVLVLTVERNANIVKLSNDIYRFIIDNPGTLLIGTTDLTHIGDRFGKYFKYPEQNTKVQKENKIISFMINPTIDTESIVNYKSSISMCGLISVKVFMLVAKKLNWLGKVVDYYDSCKVGTPYKLDRYTMGAESQPNFVSYVSIVYGDFNDEDLQLLVPFDIYLGIGLLKSNIIKSIYGKNYSINLPTWSILNNLYNSVFVGTEVIQGDSHKTNCCYGNFESKSKKNVLKKIISASDNCYRDALDRWKLPYNINLIDNMNYSIEFLELEDNWKTYPALEVYDRFKYDGKHGIYLKTPYGSATYLPVVARENMDWSIDEYMMHLSDKAADNINAWKEAVSVIKIYRSVKYTYDNNSNKLVIN